MPTIIGGMEGNQCTYPYLLYVNEMAAASGELELRASLIAHVFALGGLNVS